MAVDSTGNLYIADNNNNRVLKVPPTDPTCTTSCTTVGTGLSLPITVAVDGSGNLYIADEGNGRVVKVPPTDLACATSCTTIGTGLSHPYGVAVDGSGNLYIADFGNNQVFKETPTGGGSYTQSVLLNSSSNGLNINFHPISVAVDGSGNLYIADYGNSQVLKETYTGGAYTLSVVANSSSNGLLHPQGVAVDGSGNVYIADTSNNRVLLEVLSGSSYSQSVIATRDAPSNNGLSSPTGVAVDGSGNVYIADYGNNKVLKLDVSDAPSFTFATTTAVGSTDTTDGAQTATLYNLGNAALSFSIPGSGNNPSISTNFTLASSNTCPVTGSGAGSPGSLALGASCTVAVDFAPTAVGSLVGSLVFTDNSTVTPQTLSLSGKGVQATTQLAYGTPPPSPIALGANAGTITVEELNSSNALVTTATDAITLTVAGPNSYSQTYGPTAAVAGVASFNLSSTALSAAGTYTYTAAFSGLTSAVTTEVVNQAAQTISFTAPTSPVTFGVSPIPLVATGGASGNAVTFTVVSGSGTITGSTLTVTGAGTIVVAANQAGNTNYSAATQVTASVIVGQAVSSTSLASSTNPILVTNPTTFTASVSSTVSTSTGTVSFFDGTTLLGTVAVANGTASYTTSLLSVGPHSITADYSGNANLSASISSPVDEVVQDFTLSAGTGFLTQTAPPGGTAIFSLALSPSDGSTFPAPITLSVTGLPPGATDTISPSVLPAGSPLSDVTLSIQLPQSTASLDRSRPPSDRHIPPVLWGILLLPFSARLRRTGRRLGRTLSLLLLLAAGIAATAGLSGCGGGNGYFTQQQQAYTVTLTGTSGTLSHSITLTLNVE